MTDEQVAAYLKQLPRGFLPRPIFEAIAEKVTMTTIEMVPLRSAAEGVVEVLLTQRPADDPYWPGQWHVPGTVLRASDTPLPYNPEVVVPNMYADAFTRIFEGEIVGVKLVKGPIAISGPPVFQDTARGRELAQLYYAVVEGESTLGQFFSVTELPATMVEHQVPYVQRAVREYIALFS